MLRLIYSCIGMIGPYRLFFCFPSYCRSVGSHVVNIVSGGCNQSPPPMLLYLVFKTLYWCINTLFNAGKSSSFFSWHTYSLSTSSLGCNALWMVIQVFFVLWFICLSSSLVHFKNGPEYLTRRTAQISIPLIWFLPYSFCLE